MTIRAMLNRRMRWFNAVVYGGMGVFLAVFLVGQAFGQQVTLALAFPVFAVAFAYGMVAQYIGFLCPRCRGNLAPTLLGYSGFSANHRVCFCPYCGVGLDEELSAEASPSGTAGPTEHPEAPDLP
jgi:hypothetical protein